ncbi:MAG: FAD-dependent oxidoreductase, partial [Myxococcota bacterium]
MSTYDLVIVGSGPGGYVAAIRAAHNGLKTALVEKESKLGGTCLLRGCIPTKSLLHSADVLQEVRGAKSHGITTGEVGFDFAKVQKVRQKVVTKSAAGVAYLMKQNKVDVHTGAGRFKDASTIVVANVDGKTTLNAKHVIVATGSVPKTLPSLELDGRRVITSNEALELAEPPASMLVLGAGAVGVEFASIYNRFGTECTLVEMLDRVLPIEDTEISAEVEKLLKKRGIKLLTGTRLEKLEVKENEIVAVVADTRESTTIEAAMVLVAVGRAPYTEGLGLEAAGLETNAAGFIEVDELMRTKVESVYAIGDVVPTPQLAHIASIEALLAVDHIAGKKVEPINYLHTP